MSNFVLFWDIRSGWKRRVASVLFWLSVFLAACALPSVAMADPSGKPTIPAKFKVPEEIQKKHPELVQLMINSESIDDNTKQRYFDAMPRLTAEQMDRLFEVLADERKQLREANIKLRKERAELDKSYLRQAQEIKKAITEEKNKRQE